MTLLGGRRILIYENAVNLRSHMEINDTKHRDVTNYVDIIASVHKVPVNGLKDGDIYHNLYPRKN